MTQAGLARPAAWQSCHRGHFRDEIGDDRKNALGLLAASLVLAMSLVTRRFLNYSWPSLRDTRSDRIDQQKVVKH
jgi:hypothetical protein